MSVKHPIIPSREIPEEYCDLICDLFAQYEVIRGEIAVEKNQLRFEQIVSCDYESNKIKAKLDDLKLKNANNEHDILFLEKYPVMAVRHSLGESWGTSSPR